MKFWINIFFFSILNMVFHSLLANFISHSTSVVIIFVFLYLMFRCVLFFFTLDVFKSLSLILSNLIVIHIGLGVHVSYLCGSFSSFWVVLSLFSDSLLAHVWHKYSAE